MISGMRKRMGVFVAVIAGLLALGMIIPMLFSGTSPGGAAARLTVAKVNRERVSALDLSREFYRLYYYRTSFGGLKAEDLDALRSQALDGLVEQAIILDAAKSAGLKPDQSQVEAAYQAELAYFKNEQEFIQAMAGWAYTPKTYKQELGRRQLIDKYPLYAKPVEVTEDDVNAEFERAQKTNPKLVLDETRESIEKLVRARKEKEARDSLLAELREKAKVKIIDSQVLAYRAMQEGKFDEAVKLYRKAIKQSPEDPYLQVSLGRALAAAGKGDDSKAAFEKAVKLRADDRFILIAQADSLKEAGDTDAAADVYRHAAQVAGEDIFAHSLILEALEEMGLEDDAKAQQAKIDALQKALIERYEAQQKAAEDAQAAEPEPAEDVEDAENSRQ